MSTVAIIVAAGTSQRMGFDKLMAPLHGVSVLVRSIQAFQHTPAIDHIILVLHPSRRQPIQQAIDDLRLDKVRDIVPGGASRHASVAAGLAALPRDTRFVAIHDGARPLVSPTDITATLHAAQEHGAASLAHPVVDTLKKANSDKQVGGSIDRTNVWAMETPQVFATDLICQASALAHQQGQDLTDEVSAIELLGRSVTLVPSTSLNLKITYPADLALAERLFTP